MYGYNPKSKNGDFSDANKDRLGDGWTELERYLEWMARAHYTFAKGETQVIDLSQFTRGYDGGTYTVSAPSGVTATMSGSKLTVKLADSFAGADYVQFTLKDNAGDTFSRYIGVTQQLAIQNSGEGDSTVLNDTTQTDSSTTSIASFSPAQKFHYVVEDDVVYFYGIPVNAQIRVTDLIGKNPMLSKNVLTANGTASVSLQPFGRGVYIVNVRGMARDGSRLNKTIKVMRR
jgi:hypothetical protein